MFDPYHKWLGILPKDQPPHHYRLLSVEPFESDLDVIEGAADRQMGSVRLYQSGEHAALAAKLLNEIAAARLCLLKPKSKADYDAKLRTQLKPKDTAADEGVAYAFDPQLTELLSAQQQLPPAKSKPKSKAAPAKALPVPLIAGGIGVLLLVGIVAFFVTRGGQPEAHPKVAPAQHEVVETKPAIPTPETKQPTVNSESPEAVKRTPPVMPPSQPQIESTVEAIGPPVDLLQAVDFDRDTVMGNWKREGSSLIGGHRGRIQLPARVPDDYQLKFRIKRLDGKDTFVIGFVMAGRLGMAAFDAYGGLNCGLYVDGRQPNVNCTTRHGTVFENNRTSSVILNVHSGHLTATVDGVTVIDWHGNPQRLYCQSDHAVPFRESPFLVLARASYLIESAELIPVKPESTPPRVNRLDSWVDVMPQLDPKRDTNVSDWVLNQNVLSTPRTGIGKYPLPVLVPNEYTLSAIVEFPLEAQPESSFAIGLPTDSGYCSIVAINKDCVGLELIDGQRWHENETRLTGSFVPQGNSAALSWTVTKRGIRMDCDGRTLINWTGDPLRLSPQPDWAQPDGRKISVCSAGFFKVSKLRLGPPIDSPRPPARIPTDPGRSTDLLSLIDPKLDALAGSWTKEGTTLRVMGDVPVPKLVIPVEVPPEYRLTMRVAREPGGKIDDGDLAFNLPMGEFTEEVFLDGHAATLSGMYLDRVFLDHPHNRSSSRKQAIPSSGVHELVFTVRKTGLKVTSDDQTIFDWTGNPSHSAMHPDWVTPAGQIAICSRECRFRFEKLEIEALEPSSFPPVASLGHDGDLLKVIDPLRDSRHGEWKTSVEGLVCPAIEASHLCIPISVPERYELSALVERKKGTNELFVGLVVGGRPCAAVIDGAKSDLLGLMNLDGMAFLDSGNLTYRTYPGPLFPNGQSVQVRCLVLPDTLVVICGDKEVIRWHGDSRRLSPINGYRPQNFSTHDVQHLWLGSWNTEFVFRELSLRPLGEDETQRLLTDFTGVFPMTLQADVPLPAASMPTAVKAPSTTAAIEILSAKYGIDDKFTDLTSQVAKAAEGGLLALVVDDSLTSSDAKPDEKSTGKGAKSNSLYLRYRINGAEKSETLEQNRVFQIDARPEASAKVPKGFRLVEAGRGSGLYRESTWVDVTRQLRPFVKKDALTATSDELQKALTSKSTNPDDNLPKALLVRYQYEAQEHTALIPDSTLVSLGDVPLMPGLIMVAFDGVEFERQVLAKMDTKIETNFGENSPGPGVPIDKFSVQWIGTIKVPKTATYTFSLKNDDAARLFIDGELVIDNWARGSGEAQIKLQKKPHAIKVEFAERGLYGGIELGWKSDSIPYEVVPPSVFFHDPKQAKQLGVK